MDPQATVYIEDILETATRRFIATILGGIEDYTGVKDKQRSDTVKDTANRAKRILYRQLTGIEVESARGE